MGDRGKDPLEDRARVLCLESGQDPDVRVEKEGSRRGQPAWCTFRQAAAAERDAERIAETRASIASERPQEPRYADAPLKVLGSHQDNTLAQMRTCMSVGNVLGGVQPKIVVMAGAEVADPWRD